MRITSVSITPLPNRPIPLCRELLLFAPLLPQWPDGRQFREGAKRHASFVSKIHVVWSRNSSFWRSLSRDPTARTCVSHRNPHRNIIHRRNNSTLQWYYTHGERQWSGWLSLRDNDTSFSNISCRKTWKFAVWSCRLDRISFIFANLWPKKIGSKLK